MLASFLALSLAPGIGRRVGLPSHESTNVSAFAVADAVGGALYPELLVLAGGKAGANLTAAAAVFDGAGSEGGGWRTHGSALSEPRVSMAAASAPDGSVIYFAGGQTSGGQQSALVDAVVRRAINGSGGGGGGVAYSALRSPPPLSEPRSFLAGASLRAPPALRHGGNGGGNGGGAAAWYALFGGGEIVEGVAGSDSSTVDIYAHDSSGAVVSHTVARLSKARKKLAAAAANGVVAFAGGYTSGEKDTPTRGYRDDVDLWDAATGAWSVARLSQPRQYIVGAAAGAHLVFAGGFCSPCAGQNDTSRSHVADVLDTATGRWTSHVLAQKRSNLAAASVGGRFAVFGGGTDDGDNATKAVSRSAMVDVFDGDSGAWSTATLGAARCCLGAAGGNRSVAMVGGSDGFGAADVFTFAGG